MQPVYFQALHRLVARMGVKQVFVTAYHPQTNGQVDCLNRFVTTALRATYVDENQSDWAINWKP